MYSSVSPTKLQANRIVQLLFWLVVNIFYWEGSWLFKWTGTWEATRTVHPISTFSQQIAFCSIGLSLYFRPKGGGDGDDKNDVVYTDDDVDDDVLERKEEIPIMKNFLFLVGWRMGVPITTCIEEISTPHLCIMCFITFMGSSKANLVLEKLDKKLGLADPPPSLS